MNKDEKKASIFLIISAIAFIVCVVFGFKFTCIDDYDYDTSLIDMIISFVSFIIFIISFTCFNAIEAPIENKRLKDWNDKTFKDSNIDIEKIKFILKRSSKYGTQVLYTDDKRLYIHEIYKRITQIELSSILKIDVEFITTERNRKRIIALTTTYDNIQTIEQVKFKIITEDEVHYIDLDVSKESIDKANHFKLIMDKELESLNK